MIFYYFFKNLPLKTRPVIFIDFLETLSYFYSQYLLKSNVSIYYVTAPFNNTRTLKFEAQPTNEFFAALNQMFGGSS